MKLRFYADFWPGQAANSQFPIYASTQPDVKSASMTRVAFDVAIPDELLMGLDAVSPEVSQPELVESHDDC